MQAVAERPELKKFRMVVSGTCYFELTTAEALLVSCDG